MEEKTLQISQHARERYAERIKEKDERDIPTYVAQNKERIESDINKMVQYGEIIYQGSLKDKNIVNVILNGTWVVLTDKDNQKVITLYKIDFHLGEEFNKNFISLQLEKICEAKKNYEEIVEKVNKDKEQYKRLIEDNTQEINEIKSVIKALEAQSEGYANLVKGLEADKIRAEMEIKASIMDLVCKKEF